MARASASVLLCLLLAAGAPVVLAQTPEAGSAGRADVADDGGFDIGWVGLLGLIGLAGLRRRHDPSGPHRPR